VPKLKRTPRKKISVDQWHHMIAEAAYFRAERRGFQGGCPMEDWLAAEHEINQLYVQPEPSPRGALVFLDTVAKQPAEGSNSLSARLLGIFHEAGNPSAEV